MGFELDTGQAATVERFEALGVELHQRLGEGTPAAVREAWRWCGSRGVLGLPVAAEAGGTGLGSLDTVLALEGLGRGCADLGFLVAVNAHLWGVVMPLVQHGTRSQVERHLPGLLSGETVGAHGITEPGAGSDVQAMSARVSLEGGRVLLAGHKHLVTNAPVADLFVIYARRGDDGPLTAVLVEADTPGLEVREQHKPALPHARLGEVRLEACVVSEHHMLGAQGAGMAQFTTALEWERTCIVAPVIGAMQRQLDRTVRHARQRRQFDQPIGRFQAVSNRIVDMRVRLDAGRLLLYRAACAREGGRRAPLEASEAKLFISEAYVRSSLDAMQVRGGLGVLDGADELIDLTDAPAGTLYSGTSEIQRTIIARFMGL